MSFSSNIGPIALILLVVIISVIIGLKYGELFGLIVVILPIIIALFGYGTYYPVVKVRPKVISNVSVFPEYYLSIILENTHNNTAVANYGVSFTLHPSNNPDKALTYNLASDSTLKANEEASITLNQWELFQTAFGVRQNPITLNNIDRNLYFKLGIRITYTPALKFVFKQTKKSSYIIKQIPAQGHLGVSWEIVSNDRIQAK